MLVAVGNEIGFQLSVVVDTSGDDRPSCAPGLKVESALEGHVVVGEGEA
jgi:hypothetical protein